LSSSQAKGVKVGYLSSRYPAVSHTFIVREVAALRAVGVDVRTMSVHRAHPDHLLTDQERVADRETFAILPIPPGRLIKSHLRSFASSPIRYLACLGRTLRNGAPGVRGRLWQVFYFAEAIVLHEYCEREGIRHLHAQFADVATDVAQAVATRGGRGWSWSLALHGPVEFLDVQRNRLPQKVADAVVVRTISHFGRSQVLALLDEEKWQKVHMVRVGVDLSKYPAAVQPPPDGSLQILCVGRLIALKGQSLLIQAALELDQQGIGVRVTFVGDGPRRAALTRQAKKLGLADRVEFLGAVGQDELPRLYAAAHVFCLPSLAEGLPVVLMEAMATERPVVTSAIMGIGELVTDQINGRLVPPGSLPDLVDALAALAADPSARKRMGQAGRRKVVEEYDVRRSAEQLRLMFDVVDSGPAA
jgi:glycosyltransferase involved in cell wall biosynthesis